MGDHENRLRRNRIRLVVLKHHAGRFGGIGHDFDPLVDQQASKRLREIDGFGHVDNQRQAAWRDRRAWLRRQADPAVAVTLWKLRHLERECIAVAQRFGVLQRIVKARDAFANSRHPLMERHDGERVAILNSSARGQSTLNLGQHSADGSVEAPRSCCRKDA